MTENLRPMTENLRPATAAGPEPGAEGYGAALIGLSSLRDAVFPAGAPAWRSRRRIASTPAASPQV
jgi:hypothetical protein